MYEMQGSHSRICSSASLAATRTFVTNARSWRFKAEMAQRSQSIEGKSVRDLHAKVAFPPRFPRGYNIYFLQSYLSVPQSGDKCKAGQHTLFYICFFSYRHSKAAFLPHMRLSQWLLSTMSRLSLVPLSTFSLKEQT